MSDSFDTGTMRALGHQQNRGRAKSTLTDCAQSLISLLLEGPHLRDERGRSRGTVGEWGGIRTCSGFCVPSSSWCGDISDIGDILPGPVLCRSRCSRGILPASPGRTGAPSRVTSGVLRCASVRFGMLRPVPPPPHRHNAPECSAMFRHVSPAGLPLGVAAYRAVSRFGALWCESSRCGIVRITASCPGMARYGTPARHQVRGGIGSKPNKSDIYNGGRDREEAALPPSVSQVHCTILQWFAMARHGSL